VTLIAWSLLPAPALPLFAWGLLAWVAASPLVGLATGRWLGRGR
jgi:hypothetical protein